jgi:hypothetical protein
MRHGNKIRTSVIVPSSAERAIVTISAPVSRPFMFATRDSSVSARAQRKTGRWPGRLKFDIEKITGRCC